MKETAEKFNELLQAKRVMLFAEVDHSGEAQKIGTRMPPKMLLILANPRAETAIVLAAPSSAIDLPRRF